jgi:tRNA threonylcarbamoyl adenosine modification protein (Sua5/YciO/YrdC/YwlC family)
VGDFLTLANEERSAVKDAVLRSIRSGEVAVLASENGYIYAVDAFNSAAVERIHAIRRSERGTACQVFVGSAQTAGGVARNFDGDARTLAEKFWPGPLTLVLTPQQGLSWDLGDGGALSEFALRVPSREFLREILIESGPLAVASASVAGMPPTLDINFVPALPSDVGIYVDEGSIPQLPPSTSVRVGLSGLEMVREGAITFSALEEVISGILRLKP